MEQENISEELNEELFEHYRVVADKGQSLMRLDKFLANRLEGVSRSRIQNAADAACILVNDIPRKSNYKIKPCDVISIVLPHPPRDTEIYPENIPINIVYEDNDLIIVNKKPGMVVHPGYNNYDGTLLNALLYHFKIIGEHEDMFPLLVHRIDKDTSGLLVVAKNEAAQTFLAKQFFDHSINRKYNALVWGVPAESEGQVSGYIGRSAADRRVMCVYDDETKGKWSVTHYKVLEHYGYCSLIECELETGRTHQIRAHMKHIGHTIFSDEMYGGHLVLKGSTGGKYKQFIHNAFEMCPRQALHARTLGFLHPNGNEMFFEAPWPDDFAGVVEKFREYR